MRLALLLAAAAAASAAPAAGQGLDEIVVTERQLPELKAREAYAVTRLGRDEIESAPDLRLDDILRQVPGFSLFRRASSLVAHPTTQGVTLRSVGPNGAGRTLVLLDGVPLNDPFGGWVYWSAIDPFGLESAEVIRGGGAGPFGNQALTGVVRLESRQPEGFEARGEARYGSFDTLDLAAGAGGRIGRTALQLSGRYFESDGFVLHPEEQRGPVDVPAASDAASVTATASFALDADTAVSARIGWFGEDRINGLELATNATDALDVSVGLVRDAGRDGVSGQLALYWRDRDFASSFAAVLDDDRTTSRQVLDQFAVPAWSAGLIGLLRIPLFDDDTFEVGADVRRLEGETNERFRNLGSGFTRQRTAGGDQWLAGGWLEYAGGLTDRLALAGGVRLDWWRTFDGVRRESDLATGEILLDAPIADREDLLVNGRIGLTYAATPAIDLRAAGYSAFRLPTINEFFRPFRVGNDITEANAQLDAERLYGLEAGVIYQPLASIRLSADYFRNWLKDGVGNVTIAFGPGVFPPAGFVPEGGTLRQRQNIGEIVGDGVELSGRLTLAPQWQFELRYLFVDARVTKSPQAPELEGKEVAQSPDHTLYAAVAWQPAPRWRLVAEGRFVGDQFEDDLNSRTLDAFATLDASLFYEAAAGVTLFLTGENILSAEVESQISGDGLITLAQPQFFSGGVRLRF